MNHTDQFFIRIHDKKDVYFNNKIHNKIKKHKHYIYFFINYIVNYYIIKNYEIFKNYKL